MKKQKLNHTMKLLVLILSLGFQSSFGFDLEDYATTWRATRDALVKANKELRMSELVLIDMIKRNPKLPMRISTQSKIGAGIGCCCYEKNCAVVNTKENQLALFDKTLRNDTKLRNVELAITDFGSRVNLIDRLREDIVNYHNRLDPQILADQQTLLEDQPASSIYDEDIFFAVVNQGLSSPFGSSADDKMMQYRAARDSYMKALTEVKLAKSPFLAARSAYAEATRVYYNTVGCSNVGNVGLTFEDYIQKLGSR